MSVLEIVLYSIIGTAFIVWLIMEIIKTKHPEKFKNKKRKNSEEQDDLE